MVRACQVKYIFWNDHSCVSYTVMKVLFLSHSSSFSFHLLTSPPSPHLVSSYQTLRTHTIWWGLFVRFSSRFLFSRNKLASSSETNICQPRLFCKDDLNWAYLFDVLVYKRVWMLLSWIPLAVLFWQCLHTSEIKLSCTFGIGISGECRQLFIGV